MGIRVAGPHIQIIPTSGTEVYQHCLLGYLDPRGADQDMWKFLKSQHCP